MSSNVEHPHEVPADRGQARTIDPLGKIVHIAQHWEPRVVAEMNDYQFKVVKVAGEFVWHAHGDTDETFIVLEGELCINMRDTSDGGQAIWLRAGQMAVVPKGVEHKPYAPNEAKLLLIEPRGVVNTGDGEANGRTMANDRWI